MTERILVVQLADIGDLIVSTPALTALREAKPNAYIALLTSSHTASVVEGTGLVDRIYTLDRQAMSGTKALLNPANVWRLLKLRADRFQKVLYFHHFTLKAGTFKFALIATCVGGKQVGIDNGNGWFLNERLPDEGFGIKHQAEYWLDVVASVGASSQPRSTQIAIRAEDRTWAQTHLPAKTRPRVVIHAGSGGYSLARRWSPQNFARTADQLQQEHDVEVVLVGGKNDDTASVKNALSAPQQVIDLSEQTTLSQLAAVIQTADVYIGADSGVMHVASAVGTKVVAIFGPSNPDAWRPYMPFMASQVVTSSPKCAPCSYVEHTVGAREGCAARTCMRMVTPEQVVEASLKLLRDEPAHLLQTPQRVNQASKTIKILGFPVSAITYQDLITSLDEWISTQSTRILHHICTVNPEFLMIAQKDPIFNQILKRADLTIPDGVGLLWAARHLGTPLPERVTGSDGVPYIAEHASQKGWRLFFLGAGAGVAQQAADRLLEQHSQLQIVGVYAGSPAPEEEDAIVERINASQADILFVAYGAPEQDRWIARNSPRLKVAAAIGVGGSFDFIAGIVPRAPLWMRRMGIEWVYRLVRQPWRFKRMLRLPRFMWAVLTRGENP